MEPSDTDVREGGATPAPSEPATEPSTEPTTDVGDAHWNACGVHRDQPATFTCSRCGTFGCPRCLDSMQPMPLCVECAARGVNAVPWERRESLGLWTGFWETTRLACLTPKDFFARPAIDSLGGGAFYGVVSYTVGNVLFAAQIAVFYAIVGLVAGASAGDGAAGAAMGVGFGAIGCVMVPAMGIQAPVMAVFGLAFAMAGAHLSLMLMQQARGSWEASLRGVGYANAAYMWYAIPCVGPFITPFAVVWLETRAMAAAHGTTTFAAFAATTLWRLFLVVGFIALYAALIAMLMGSATGLADPTFQSQ
ncbi:MAG: hypothetical protein R3B40_13750 [Polyangiales bacterium]